MASIPPDKQPDWLAAYSEKLDRIDTIVKGLAVALEDLTTSVSFAAHAARVATRKADATHREVNELKLQNLLLKTQLNILEKQMLYQESQARRNNLVFDGISEVENETWAICEDALREILMNKMEIEGLNLHRIGTKSPGKQSFLILNRGT